jgi:hypothetical protein
MHTSQLREWIRRYGDWGLAMVAVFLALRFLSKRKCWLLVAVAGLFFTATRLHHRTQPAAPKTATLGERGQGTPTPPEAVSLEDEPPEVIKFAVSSDEWRFVVTWVTNAEETQSELSVYRNGRLVRKLRAEALDGMGLEIKRITLPSGNSVVGVLSFPGAGHATAKHFFTVRDRQLLYMGKVGGENGGPVFRDGDGDGRGEWVFDNYCWYEQYTEGPTQYLVFKATKAGTLRLWKRFPNPKHERLPDRFHFEDG